MPGRPIDDHRRLILEIGQRRKHHRLVGAPHALRVDDRLRHPGRAGGEQKFRDGVGPDAHMCGVNGCRRGDAPKVGQFGAATACDRIARDHDLNIRRNDGFNRTRELRARRDEHQPGRQQVEDMAKFCHVVRNQRVGRRDRRIRHADIVGRKADQRVLDVVAGEDHDRPLGGQIAPEQRFANCADKGQRLRISHTAPAATPIALREKNAVAPPSRPNIQDAPSACRGSWAEDPSRADGSCRPPADRQQRASGRAAPRVSAPKRRRMMRLPTCPPPRETKRPASAPGWHSL